MSFIFGKLMLQPPGTVLSLSVKRRANNQLFTHFSLPGAEWRNSSRTSREKRLGQKELPAHELANLVIYYGSRSQCYCICEEIRPSENSHAGGTFGGSVAQTIAFARSFSTCPPGVSE